MKLAVALALSLSLAACAGGGYDRDDWLRPAANPSKVIATELAFARMAREEGASAAFRHYSTSDALRPSPGLVNVRDAPSGAPDSVERIVWSPDKVWSSCDGSFAVSTGGAEYPGGRQSRFLTVWQRQNDGEYRWVLDQDFGDPQAQANPEIVEANVADCPSIRQPGERARRGESWGSNRSDDGTLSWTTEIAADCSRVATIRLSRDGAMDEVFRREAAAAAGTSTNACAG